MSAGWVAGSVRARAMARRRLGTQAVRSMARGAGLDEALESLARSPYGAHVHAGAGLADAERGVAATLLWNLRVLAGWLPAAGAEMLRLLAGWFEIANIDDHLRVLAGRDGEPPFRLGTLCTAWPQLSKADSVAELRDALGHSAWGDPGADSAEAISTWLRVTWARRVSTGIAAARRWAGGGCALLVARELFVSGTRLPEPIETSAIGMLGVGWMDAGSLSEFAARLPSDARWALREVADASQLWQAEARWWARLRSDGLRLLAASGFGPNRVLGAVAVLAVDAWQTRAALEVASREGVEPETVDAVA